MGKKQKGKDKVFPKSTFKDVSKPLKKGYSSVAKKPTVKRSSKTGTSTATKRTVSSFNKQTTSVGSKSSVVLEKVVDNSSKKQDVRSSKVVEPLSAKHPPFPFWARLKIGKMRTTLVIDEEVRFNPKKDKDEDGFVHREAQHPTKKGATVISPNPDKTDDRPMYLKKASWLPKYLFMYHNKDLDMPQSLKDMYTKNNKK